MMRAGVAHHSHVSSLVCVCPIGMKGDCPASIHFVISVLFVTQPPPPPPPPRPPRPVLRSLWKLCCWYEEGRPSPPLTFVTFVLFVILRPGNPKPQTQVTTTLWPFCYWPTHFPVQHLASLPSYSSLFLHLLSAPLCPSTILDVSAFSPVVLFLAASFSDVVGRLGFALCLIVLSTCAVFAPKWVACLLPALLLLPCICYCQAVTGEILFLHSRDMQNAIRKRPFSLCLCLLSVFALICFCQLPVYVYLRSSISAWHFFVGVRRSFFFLFIYGMYTAAHKDCCLCKAVCFAWTSKCFGTFYIIFLGFYFSPNVVKCLLLRTGNNLTIQSCIVHMRQLLVTLKLYQY